MLNDSESSPTFWDSVQNIAIQVLQAIDIRLALIMGLVAFMVAVGFDSSGNQAKAADFMNQASLVPVRVSARGVSAADSRSFAPSTPVDEARLATAQRLRHGHLTSAILTSNRLTEAHFFTDLPAGQ